MKKKDVFAGFDNLAELLLTALSESEHLKKQMQELVEENTRLRLENRQLQAVLEQLEKPHETTGVSQTSIGHLETVYDEGFHICNDFYGQSRTNREDCAFCMELLYRD